MFSVISVVLITRDNSDKKYLNNSNSISSLEFFETTSSTPTPAPRIPIKKYFHADSVAGFQLTPPKGFIVVMEPQFQNQSTYRLDVPTEEKANEISYIYVPASVTVLAPDYFTNATDTFEPGYLTPQLLSQIMTAKVGEEILTRPGYAVGDKDREYWTVNRLPNIVIDGVSAAVVENKEVWEGRPNSITREIYLQHNGYTFIWRVNYVSSQELKEFTRILQGFSLKSSLAANEWRAYRNTNYGYTINFPGSWYDLPNVNAPDTYAYFSNQGQTAPMDSRPGGIFVIIDGKRKNQDLQTLFSTPVGNVMTHNNEVLTKLQELSINGNQAVQYSSETAPGAETEHTYSINYLVKHQDQVFNIAFVIYSKTISAIDEQTIDVMAKSFRVE